MGLSLDALGTGQVSYHMMVNPSGIQLDMLNGASGDEDLAPDWVWESAGQRNERGYAVEIRLPLESIRFSGGESVRMGILFWRRVSRLGVSVSWPALEPGKWVFDKHATLTFARLEPRLAREVIPFATYSWGSARVDSPAWEQTANRGDLGFSTAPDAMARVIDVNLTGVIRTVSATLDAMIAARGYYLLVASAASFAPMPGLAAYAASKSGVEQFANAFRYEVAYRGIDVGSAHPCWIDTDLVRDAHDDLPAFRAILARLPPPFGTITSIDRCVDGLVGAIERRARKAYVPRTLVPFAVLRHVLVTPPFDFVLRRNAAQSVPDLERDSQTLGRSFGLHSVETQHTDVQRRD